MINTPGDKNTDPNTSIADDDWDALQAEIDEVKAEVTSAEEKVNSSHHENDAEATPQDNPQGEDGPTPEQAVAALQAELADMKDKVLRAMAETENVKRRAEREVAAARIFGIERFALDILSVHDNLGRAISTLDGKAREDMGENAKHLLEGIELTEKDLMAALARHGITAVQGKGSKFDPKVHQAVAQIPSDEEKGTVATVMQTGFVLGDRTLRAAMVAVSTGPAAK